MISIGQGVLRTCAGIRRREFLRVGGLSLGSLGLSFGNRNAAAMDRAPGDRAVILLMLVGGPSQLETWDPKPDAAAEIRGPFRSIPTRVPGVRINEHLPMLAARLDQVALVRSLHHDAAPIHETGFQLLQTGRLSDGEGASPHIGAVASRMQGPRRGMPPWTILPRPIASTGVNIPHGQDAGQLGPAHEAFHLDDDPGSDRFDAVGAANRARRHLDAAAENGSGLAASLGRLLGPSTLSAFDLSREPLDLRRRYGLNRFGQSCLLARRLVEHGTRVVTVNMFETVFNTVTWDCHGSAPFSTLDDYARELLPALDRALSALLDDLRDRRLLESTLVVATGEFGRTPKLNATGGRDHWPGVWSALLAGGGVRGGQVVGASDAQAATPAQRPVRPEELLATIYRSLGLPNAQALARPSGEPDVPVASASPIEELFA